ncbi:MAG TPA: pyridoxal phosphate-dependent aminotransferase [Candidatus Latescibacteria bacterium]|nr:pyridoxal phosphate-dependent aminotransferase [Candidatus Latescibacterota bacterium]HQE61349.1 pyridoxal phosphate-dependent aminotransferase [Candidatus Latescibacterota bacterium]HQK22943.1 pyridoxal phosphate-dependent aminotransferase [Candidatus Latescibacterota bacterium]
MGIAKTIATNLEQSSWIRRMFEEGIRLKAERGPEHVYDFTLGNPDIEPPPEVIAVLERIVARNRPRSHAYMPNAGFPEVRAVIARKLARRTGLAYTADHILMTAGAAGAINVVLKSLLDPGDEVIVLAPYFAEYRFYIENHGGVMVVVPTDDAFMPDTRRIRAAITSRTKAILINTPNNPTGAVYGPGVLRSLNELIEEANHPITIVSDEPYVALTFDGVEPPETASLISRSVVTYSWSKALAIPGERIGYIAISPLLPEAADLFDACTFANRVLGFVNASAIWQLVVAEAGDVRVDATPYQEKRDFLWDALTRMGYEIVKPGGAFYLFPKSPLPDDVAFIRLLQKEGILAVPGSGFGTPGYFRLSLTVPKEMMERSLPGFERTLHAAEGNGKS